MKDLDNERWQALLAVNDRVVDASQRLHDIPAPVWNRMMDEWNAAIAAVRGDSFLMQLLRERVASTSGAADLSLLHHVLGGAVLDHGNDIRAILSDPRVLNADEIDARASLYIVEAGEESDPYEAEDTEDEWRDLTRIGGVPTTTSVTPPVDRVFLLQIDLAALRRQAAWDDATASVLRASPLPEDGLLQVFHTTTGDSRSELGSPGGGATIVHVTEESVIARGKPARERAFRGHAASIAALPTFRQRERASDAALDVVEALQEDAYRVARNGSFPPGYDDAFARNPFTARAGAVSHLLGLPSPDFGLTDEDAELLARELPPADADDEHVLFLEVAGDRTFDFVFGDDGRLEIWGRASDLARFDYSHLVSFLRSA